MIRRAQDYLGILTIASTALQRLPLACGCSSPDLIPSLTPTLTAIQCIAAALSSGIPIVTVIVIVIVRMLTPGCTLRMV